MSGGSYNYVSVKDAADLIENPNLDQELEWMHDRLKELGYADAAAADTLEFLQRLQAARQFIPTLTDNLIPQFYDLQKVWRAVEWWDSNDGNEQQVREAVANYPQERTTKAEETLVHISLPANVMAALLSHVHSWNSQQQGSVDNLLEKAAESMEETVRRQGLDQHPDTGRQRSSLQGVTSSDNYRSDS